MKWHPEGKGDKRGLFGDGFIASASWRCRGILLPDFVAALSWCVWFLYSHGGGESRLILNFPTAVGHQGQRLQPAQNMCNSLRGDPREQETHTGAANRACGTWRVVGFADFSELGVMGERWKLEPLETKQWVMKKRGASEKEGKEEEEEEDGDVAQTLWGNILIWQEGPQHYKMISWHRWGSRLHHYVVNKMHEYLIFLRRGQRNFMHHPSILNIFCVSSWSQSFREKNQEFELQMFHVDHFPSSPHRISMQIRLWSTYRADDGWLVSRSSKRSALFKNNAAGRPALLRRSSSAHWSFCSPTAHHYLPLLLLSYSFSASRLLHPLSPPLHPLCEDSSSTFTLMFTLHCRKGLQSEGMDGRLQRPAIYSQSAHNKEVPWQITFEQHWFLL